MMQERGDTYMAHTGYKLHDEVKTAGRALRRAASLGVLAAESAALFKREERDAILVMSFGTTFKETREKTILAVVEEIRREHPNAKVMLAFTSHIVIERVKANEGISYPTPEEALQKLKDDGYTRVALVSLDIIPGIEYAYKREVFEECRTWFYRMTLGTPLVYWQGQEEKRDDVADVMTAVAKDLPPCAADEAVLLMTHGTPHPANAYYTVMQERLEQQGQHRIYIYSVEGRPHLDDVLPKLKKACIKKVTLVPLMLVAGDHATNDMAGDAPDSHKAVLEREGFVVQTILRGIGENDAVRKIFTARAHEAYEALYDGSLCNDV